MALEEAHEEEEERAAPARQPPKPTDRIAKVEEKAAAEIRLVESVRVCSNELQTRNQYGIGRGGTR
jgi:hypothetical protein